MGIIMISKVTKIWKKGRRFFEDVLAEWYRKGGRHQKRAAVHFVSGRK
jgi:hypothetical protein